jgi:hypothetical protein
MVFKLFFHKKRERSEALNTPYNAMMSELLWCDIMPMQRWNLLFSKKGLSIEHCLRIQEYLTAQQYNVIEMLTCLQSTQGISFNTDLYERIQPTKAVIV